MTRKRAATHLRLQGKRLLRLLVPHSYRPRVRRSYNRLTWGLYTGGRVSCNCCEGRFRQFRTWADDSGRRWPMCPRCGSLGRHRVDWLFLTQRTDLQSAKKRLLHVAPEVCLQRCFQRLENLSYVSADYDSALAAEHFDVTDIPYPDESFDAIVCNHVLEHVDDDQGAMRELFRVLTVGGWAILQVPVDVSRAKTFEDASVTEPHERLRLFGQHDHVRVYGQDYSNRLEEAGFTVTVDDFVSTLPENVLAEFGLDSQERIYFCRKQPRG